MTISTKLLTVFFLVQACVYQMAAEDLQIQIERSTAIKAPTTQGRSYILEATGDLNSPSWKPVSLPFFGDGYSKTLLQSSLTSAEYYRVAEYDLNADLVGYYPMNGNANDFSGNNNHGTISGAVGVDDRFGKPNSAYSFNGVDQLISIPSSTVLNPGSGEFTISVWVKFGAINQDFAILGKSDGSNFANKWILQYRNSPNSFTFHVNSLDGTANSQSGTAPWNYVSNSWVHVVTTKSNSTYRTFIDGNLISETTGPGTIPSSTGALTLGEVEGNEWFQGTLDDLRIYSRAITPGEVKAIYYESDSNVNAGLVGHYEFNGNLADSSVYGNTAVNDGAVFTTDRFGRSNRAMYFDGTNTVVVTDQSQYAAMNSEMTVAAWVQFDTPPRQIHIIGKSEGQFEHNKWILLFKNDPQNFSFHVNTPPTITFGGKASWLYSTNYWYHLAATKSGTNYSTYINGVMVATSTGPAQLPTVNANIILGGAEGIGTGADGILQLKGKLDDVRLYSRALSPREIKLLAESFE